MQAVFETLFDAVYLISLACCCGELCLLYSGGVVCRYGGRRLCRFLSDVL